MQKISRKIAVWQIEKDSKQAANQSETLCKLCTIFQFSVLNLTRGLVTDLHPSGSALWIRDHENVVRPDLKVVDRLSNFSERPA